jgi:tRNA (guanine37-N1)-methyltransferase
MRIDVFSLFPEVITSYCATSILGRAQQSGALTLGVHDLRDGADDARRTVDDSPFGGGAGMVLMAEPVFRCVEGVADLPRPLFLLAPGGRRFDQSVAEELAALAPAGDSSGGGSGSGGGFSLLCGRYEGVDQRVADHLVDGELSVGEYVLAGGELAALVVIEAVARLLPHVLGNEESSTFESFADGLLEYPQFTRPADFRGWEVPGVLRSGDHAAVAAWRRTEALLRTAERRPDLIDRLRSLGGLSPGDMRDLARHGYDVMSGTEPGPPKDASHAPH